MWKFKVLILGFFGFNIQASLALAAENVELKNYFVEKINQVQNSSVVSSQMDAGSGMQLQDVNIDLSPSVSFGISEVLKITVSPEIDFVLVPEIPDSLVNNETQEGI